MNQRVLCGLFLGLVLLAGCSRLPTVHPVANQPESQWESIRRRYQEGAFDAGYYFENMHATFAIADDPNQWSEIVASGPTELKPLDVTYAAWRAMQAMDWPVGHRVATTNHGPILGSGSAHGVMWEMSDVSTDSQRAAKLRFRPTQ